MTNFKEKAYDDLDCDDFGTFCATQKAWITRIYKLKKKYPDKVIIKRETKDSVIAQIPKTWFKITPARKYSAEAKAKIAKRLQASKTTD
jgi:hypothetical protein